MLVSVFLTIATVVQGFIDDIYHHWRTVFVDKFIGVVAFSRDQWGIQIIKSLCLRSYGIFNSAHKRTFIIVIFFYKVRVRMATAKIL
jgi:hypothetical protein